MAYTPVVLIAAGNLASNIGLQPNTTMVSHCNTISNNALVSRYANLQPGTAYGTILSGRSFSVTSLNLPLYIANANTVVSSIRTQFENILPDNGNGTYNIAKFAGILQTAGSFASTSLGLTQALEDFSNKNFDDLGISITNYSTAVTNGLSAVFGTEPQIEILAAALENFGTAYDVTQLNKLGDPATFIQHLINLGFGEFVPGQGIVQIGGSRLPDNWRTADPYELTVFLSGISGATLEKIISQTKMKLPDPLRVTNLSHLLELSRVFPAAAVDLIAGGNFAGLSNEFINLGGNFKSFSEIAATLRRIEVPTLTNLDEYATLIPDENYTQIKSKLGTGNGTVNNPTILDLIGTVAGHVHVNALSTISESLVSTLTYTNAQTLSTALLNLASACATGNNTYIDSNITIVQNAANSFNSLVSSNVSLGTISSSGNAAIVACQTQLTNETTNLGLAGIALSDSTAPGVQSALSLTNALHDYGVDNQNLGYNILFEGIAQSNAAGESVMAALAEGRNIDAQLQKSIQVLTRF